MLKADYVISLGITAALTLMLLIIVYPLLQAKYGLTTGLLLCGLLVTGMLLYYLRGVMISGNKK